MTVKEAQAKYPTANVPDNATDIREYTKKRDIKMNSALYVEEKHILEYVVDNGIVKVLVSPVKRTRKVVR